MIEKLAELKHFERQLKMQKQELDNGKEAASILNGLLKSGQIKQASDGSWGVIQKDDPKKKWLRHVARPFP